MTAAVPTGRRPRRTHVEANGTGMLASVTSVAEAQIALHGGADVIDVKDPRAGALGAAPPSGIREIVARLRARCIVSATTGDLPHDPQCVAEAVDRVHETGVDLVKVGMFCADAGGEMLDALASRAARGVRIVAVIMADRWLDLEWLETAARRGLTGVMLDTADKDGGSLRAEHSDAALAAFVKRARGLGLLTGLAGRLSLEDIAPLLRVGPDYLGFRSALCVASERKATLDADAVARVRGRIPARWAMPGS